MTTTMTAPQELETAIQDLNAMVLEGRALEAFEKYYADDCVMQEGAQEPWVGKDVNRKREEDFFSKITEFRGAEVGVVAVGEGVTMVEWHFDYSHAEWGDVKYDQIAVQKWEDGKIVHERFYRAV